MDPIAVRNLLDHDRRNVAMEDEVLERVAGIARLRAADASYHEIAWSWLDAGDVDASIAAEIEHHRQLGVGFEWKLCSHDPPADLLERLRRHGFDVGPMEAVLVLDLGEDHGWIDAAAGACVVTRARSPEEVEVYRRVAEATFGDGDDHAPIAAALNEAIRRGSTQQGAYVGYAGEEPVSVGRLYTNPASAFAGLYGGATIAAYRGRGFYRALVAARARDATAAGARYLRVDALPTSRPILERLGFFRVADTCPCEWHVRSSRR